ncbi:MAG TPA: L,D-transpeptidase [Albitalea sp.]|nr:L,D-transpeptidase [Albitalea sp.]
MWLAGKALRALAVVCLCAAAAVSAKGREVEPASDDVRTLAAWVTGARDNQGLPFAIVDKRAAKLYLFEPKGRVIASSAVLLGAARGDRSTPGVGKLPPAQIPWADRTTPAGRFETEPGRNLDGEDVVWFDYDAGLAIHRLRPAAPAQQRAERLASASADAHRISAGCVVVPVAFFTGVIQPTLGRSRGVVYVLPEMHSLREVFAAAESF